jgi:glycosyltransferase involved in cell wall biosynthesis
MTMDGASQPTVSIVLPVHNGARFLREAIDSCLAQLFRDFELIAVDDCSNDATPEILAEYACRDSRIRPIRNDTNLGLPRSLNRGFAAATGRYFTWTSDDNRLRPAALTTLTAILDRRPEVDVVYSDYSVIDESGAVVALRRVSPIDRVALANCVGASFVYRRAVHEALGGFDAGKPLVEDYDFWLRAAGRFGFEPVAIDLYEYRLHARSLSEQHDAEILSAHRRLLRDAVPRMHWLGRGGQARACVHLARTTLARGDARAALEDLWLGCRLAPEAVAADCAARAYRGLFRRSAAA